MWAPDPKGQEVLAVSSEVGTQLLKRELRHFSVQSLIDCIYVSA